MTTNTLTQITLPLLLAAGVCSAQCLVIDDFTTGKYKVQLSVANATTTNYADPNFIQTGTMLGGTRETAFEISGNPFGQIGQLRVAFAITKFETVTSATASTKPCAFVANNQ